MADGIRVSAVPLLTDWALLPQLAQVDLRQAVAEAHGPHQRDLEAGSARSGCPWRWSERTSGRPPNSPGGGQIALRSARRLRDSADGLT